MCDTIVAVPPATADGAVWFGKNSDREPDEAQLVEHHPGQRHAPGAAVRCTYLELPQAAETHEVVLCRPYWMWGAEMGANEHGLAIGNEAVFTRLPVPKTGLTGMDLLRLALERAKTAREALDLITWLLARYDQGGGCGHRGRGFRYHNSFILADPAEAWVLETAGPHWAAQRVRGIRTISNALSIGRDWDLISEDAYAFAKRKGWCRSAGDFDFARCYGSRPYRVLTGGVVRAACTARRLEAAARPAVAAAAPATGARSPTTAHASAPSGTATLERVESAGRPIAGGAVPGVDERVPGGVRREDLFAALRDHGGRHPKRGWRMEMPCAHATRLPTRRAGQTTGSMVSRLIPGGGSVHYLTGTSAPCLSVFKPFATGGEPLDPGPSPGAAPDESLWWRQERLHRAVMRDYAVRRAALEEERAALEARLLAAADAGDVARAAREGWDEHRRLIPEWARRIERAG